ncbi:MAG: urate hydroxylase PuuD [Caulobacteraceae bacterium]
MLVSLALAAIMILAYGMHSPSGMDRTFWIAVFRWVHVLSGILWIGLLYYFNFVQIRKMPDIPAELKPGISKYIAPEALFWFRWAALATVLAGIVIAVLRGYLVDVLTLGMAGGFDPALDGQPLLLGVGVWLALIMFINVWGVIWPNQKRALGLVPADDTTKAKAAKTAMAFSRINTLLSLPMLVSMTMSQTIFG